MDNGTISCRCHTDDGDVISSLISKPFMIFTILIGVILGTGGASFATAVAITVLFVIAHAAADIVLRKNLITGSDSNYALYISSLERTGGLPPRPWVSYLIQSCAFYIPIALIVYFVAKYFAA
jgi:hypothetical protein